MPIIPGHGVFLYNEVTAMDLTHTATIARRAIIIGIAFFLLSILGYTGFRVYKAYQIANRPPVEEKPDFKFGNLPAPQLPPTLASSSNFTYTLDTKTGGLPSSEKVIKVYFMPKPFATLLAAEKTAEMAAKFEINSEPTILFETVYRYQMEDKSVTLDLESSNFSYSQQTLEKAEQKPVEEDKDLVRNFKNLLISKGLFKEELEKGLTKIQLIKIEDNKQTGVTARSEANGATISIWPADLDKKPILTSSFNKALINATVISSADDLDNYLNINYTFWQIDTSSFAKYPLKTPEQALEQLKSGDGILLIVPVKPQVSITSVYLAYFQPEEYTPYLLPIYVFEGQGFVAYVPAISEQESTTIPPP